ncbi:MAG: hypothetical protein ACI4VQ_03910, partial [Clostridia bacterium]
MKNNDINTKFKSMSNLVKEYFHKIFYEEEPNNYNFTLSDTTNAILTDRATSYDNELKQENLTLDNETIKSLDTSKDKVFSSIDVNLEYIKVRYNSMINSDVKISEFTLNA